MIVSWNTTNACNLRCAHCYRDAGAAAERELSTDEARLLIDGVAAAGFRLMIFSGGEPLLRPDLPALVRHATSRGLRAVLGSNGTLITATKAAELKDAGVMAVGISLDSLDAAAHDRFRGLDGCHALTVAALRHCRQAGLPFQIHTTVMTWNAPELEALTDFAVAQGAVAHHLFFLVPTGRGADIADESLPRGQYADAIRRIMAKQREVDIELKPTCAPQFVRVAETLGVPTRFRRGCLAGLSYCIVTPSGNVQPCAYLPVVAGDVRRQPFAEIWRGSDVFTRLRSQRYGGACGECEHRAQCGGCRARAAVCADGDFMAADPWCPFA